MSRSIIWVIGPLAEVYQITNALSDNMLADVGMTTANCERASWCRERFGTGLIRPDNTGMTIFYLCFLFAELPSQMSESPRTRRARSQLKLLSLQEARQRRLDPHPGRSFCNSRSVVDVRKVSHHLQMMSWSAVAIGQVGINGKSSFYATRAVLGLIEGGFIADTILYLSYYYSESESGSAAPLKRDHADAYQPLRSLPSDCPGSGSR